MLLNEDCWSFRLVQADTDRSEVAKTPVEDCLEVTLKLKALSSGSICDIAFKIFHDTSCISCKLSTFVVYLPQRNGDHIAVHSSKTAERLKKMHPFIAGDQNRELVAHFCCEVSLSWLKWFKNVQEVFPTWSRIAKSWQRTLPVFFFSGTVECW